jgi:hypothetical protein
MAQYTGTPTPGASLFSGSVQASGGGVLEPVSAGAPVAPPIAPVCPVTGVGGALPPMHPLLPGGPLLPARLIQSASSPHLRPVGEGVHLGAKSFNLGFPLLQQQAPNMSAGSGVGVGSGGSSGAESGSPPQKGMSPPLQAVPKYVGMGVGRPVEPSSLRQVASLGAFPPTSRVGMGTGLGTIGTEHSSVTDYITSLAEDDMAPEF